MIGSDEFPFNDPFLDPKSRGRRGERKEGETQSSPFPTASPPSQLFLLRHSWTFHAPLKTALYLPLPRTRDVPLPRLLPVLGQKSSRSTGKKGRNKWLVLAFPRLFRFSPHSMYDDPLSNSRNLDSMRIPFARRPRFRFGFARLVGDSILTLRRNLDGLSSKLERNEREDLEMNGFWIWVFNFWKRWKIFVRGGMYRLCDIRILPMEWRDIYERT